MSNARTLAANLPTSGPLSNRNLIMNGAMQVWQRGTSFTGSYSARPYTADRWQIYTVASGSIGEVYRSADVPTNQGFLYSALFSAPDTSAPVVFTTTVELPLAGNPYPFIAGQRYTLSAWVKTTDADRAKLFTARFATSISSGVQLCTVTEVIGHTGSGDWEQVVYYVDMPETFSIGSSNQLRLMFGNKDGTGSNQTDAYYTGIQLEVGSAATPFEHRSYGEELIRCQRYFQTNYNSVSNWIRSGTVSSSATGNRESIPFMNQMRAAPTMTLTFDSLINIATGYPIVGQVGTTNFNVNVDETTSGSHFRYAVNYQADAEL